MSDKTPIPTLYLPSSHPDYLPAWRGCAPLDCCLVLEGGAMRGQFTAGVLDYLMDEGILPDTVVGVSAGALIGFNYRAGARGRSSYLNVKYCTDWRYFSMRSFVLTGNAFNADYVFRRIPEELEPFDFASFDASPIALYTVASDLELGEADYHRMRHARAEMDWLRASASMPLLSQIVKIGDKKLLDGGICDSVPIEFAATLGRRRTIIVLTQDAGYVKPPYRLMLLARKLYQDYPWFVERMAFRYYEYNRAYRKVARMEKTGEAFVLRPPVAVEIASMEHDPHKLYDLYLLGYGEAQYRSRELREYLN
jgi:predicted patatin/cPLA2 family phospholipase